MIDFTDLPNALKPMVLEWGTRLAAAVLVLIVGMLVAHALRRAIERVAAGRIESPAWLSRLVYYSVLLVTLAIAAQQAGLETVLLNRLLLVSFATLVLSIGFAFMLGARASFESYIARYHYERLVRPGDRIRVDGLEGVVVRYSPVALVLSRGGKEWIIPCRKLHDSTIELERVDAPLPVPLAPVADEDDSIVVDDQHSG